MIRAVVFDFDGVIANSEPLHFRAFRDALGARDVTLSEREYYDRYLGFDDVGAFEAIAADRQVAWNRTVIAELVADKAARMERLERDGSVLFPGAPQAVARLAAVCPLAIASGALRAEIDRVLEHAQLARHFRAIVAAEDTPRSKPAPDPYLRAVSRLSEAVGSAIAPADCVAIEDSEWGLESARAAGLRTIGITHTYAVSALPAAERIVHHLDELTWALVSSFADGANKR